MACFLFLKCSEMGEHGKGWNRKNEEIAEPADLPDDAGKLRDGEYRDQWRRGPGHQS